MKKEYFSPDFDFAKFNFEKMLTDDIDAPRLHHSDPQGYGEDSGELD